MGCVPAFVLSPPEVKRGAEIKLSSESEEAYKASEVKAVVQTRQERPDATK